MFSAPRAGSGAGDAGPDPSPISHLSETMRALLDIPGRARAGEGAGAGRSRGEAGKREVAASLALALSSLHPPRHLVNFSLFLEIKKQTNNANSRSLMKESFYCKTRARGLLNKPTGVLGFGGGIGRGAPTPVLELELSAHCQARWRPAGSRGHRLRGEAALWPSRQPPVPPRPGDGAGPCSGAGSRGSSSAPRTWT